MITGMELAGFVIFIVVLAIIGAEIDLRKRIGRGGPR